MAIEFIVRCDLPNCNGAEILKNRPGGIAAAIGHSKWDYRRNNSGTMNESVLMCPGCLKKFDDLKNKQEEEIKTFFEP